MSDLIRVLVVDDHLIVRRGLASLLTARNGMLVVGEAADGEEAIVKARHLQPDVILMDLMLPRIGGLAAIRIIRAENPNARILVLTAADEEEHITAVLQAGALGFLPKDIAVEDILLSIQYAAKGGIYLPQEIVQKLIRHLQAPVTTAPSPVEFTAREVDVLASIAKGMSNQEIADCLLISRTTVRTHVRNILSKLGATNRTQAALFAIEAGILPPHAQE
jgi:DNA-binding NarL/FixJ family response regulator